VSTITPMLTKINDFWEIIRKQACQVLLHLALLFACSPHSGKDMLERLGWAESAMNLGFSRIEAQSEAPPRQSKLIIVIHVTC